MKNVFFIIFCLSVILFLITCSIPLGESSNKTDDNGTISAFDPSKQCFAPQNVSTLIVHGDEILNAVVNNYPGIKSFYGDEETFKNLVNADLIPGVPPTIESGSNTNDQIDPSLTFSEYYSICYPNLFTIVQPTTIAGTGTSSVPPWMTNVGNFVAVEKGNLESFANQYQSIITNAPNVKIWFDNHATNLAPAVNDIGKALGNVFGEQGSSGIFQATKNLFPAIENSLGIIGSAIGLITTLINFISPGSQPPSPFQVLSDQITEFENHVTQEFAGLDLDLTQFFTRSFDAGISSMTSSLATLQDYAKINDTADMAAIIPAVATTYAPLLAQYNTAACASFKAYINYLKTMPISDERRKVVASDYYLTVTINYGNSGQLDGKYPVIDSSDKIVLINPAKYACDNNLQFMDMDSLKCLDSYITEFMNFGPYMSSASGNPVATDIWNYNQAVYILNTIVIPLRTTIDHLSSQMNASLQDAYAKLDIQAAPAFSNIGAVVWLNPHTGPAAQLISTSQPYYPYDHTTYYTYNYYPLVDASYRGHGLLGFEIIQHIPVPK